MLTRLSLALHLIGSLLLLGVQLFLLLSTSPYMHSVHNNSINSTQRNAAAMPCMCLFKVRKSLKTTAFVAAGWMFNKDLNTNTNHLDDDRSSLWWCAIDAYRQYLHPIAAKVSRYSIRDKNPISAETIALSCGRQNTVSQPTPQTGIVIIVITSCL